MNALRFFTHAEMVEMHQISARHFNIDGFPEGVMFGQVEDKLFAVWENNCYYEFFKWDGSRWVEQDVSLPEVHNDEVYKNLCNIHLRHRLSHRQPAVSERKAAK